METIDLRESVQLLTNTQTSTVSRGVVEWSNDRVETTLYEDKNKGDCRTAVFCGEMRRQLTSGCAFTIVDSFTGEVLLRGTFQGGDGLYSAGGDVDGEAVSCCFAVADNTVEAAVPKSALPHIFCDEGAAANLRKYTPPNNIAVYNRREPQQ